MKPLLTIILFCFMIAACSDKQDYSAGPQNETVGLKNQQAAFMHPAAQIDFVKRQLLIRNEPYQSAYLRLIRETNNALETPHHALEDFSIPGYYQNPTAHIQNAASLRIDAFNVYSRALAYRLGAGDQYGVKACELLNAWAEINKKYSEYDGSLAMACSGTALVIAAQLMSDSDLWSEEERSLFDQWIINVFQKACNEIRYKKNNWADWGRFGSMLCAVYFNDRDEINENVRLIKSDLFLKIAQDGSMPEETCRGEKGIWYTYFSLAPISAACWLVYNSTGENLFTWENNGVSMKTALDYLFYYNQHPSEWEWYDNPETGHRNWWPGNLLEAMSGIYNDQDYVQFVRPNRPLMYTDHHYVWTFPTLMPLSLAGYE